METPKKTPLTLRLDYTKLWKLLIDKKRKKEDLRREAGVSAASISRLTRGENVTTDTLLRICQYLDCDIADICEVVSSNPKRETN
ncbi:helix-turn-helix domain-containing protein [Trueperella bialowiezensis]|nr:helix-turn-helix transcriptional regulator [Trueperella bialowiezensis]